MAVNGVLGLAGGGFRVELVNLLVSGSLVEWLMSPPICVMSPELNSSGTEVLGRTTQQ